MARPKVLMASGSPVFSRALVRTLAGSGCDIVAVHAPEEIRRWAASGSIEMCVIQDSLRGVSGLDLGAELTGAEASPPVVVFSRDATVEPAAKERGAAGFIRVPVHGDAHGQILQSVLAAAPAPSTTVDVVTPAPPPPPPAPPETAPAPVEPPAPVETPDPVAAPASAAPAPTVELDEGDDADDDSPKRILLVDDSKVIQTHVGGILRDEGYEVLGAMDGVEGLAVANAEIPDLIISDVEMPNMDGFEMCSKVKKGDATQDIPVIMLSSRGGSMDIDRGFDSGANDYLTKPLDEDALFSLLEQIFSGDQGKREKVVVAEDSLVQRNLIVQGLEQQGFDVRSAKNGKLALEHVLEDTPDLIITDCDMPVMDGREFTREVRTHDHLAQVPIVMLTAADSAKERTKGLHAGVNAYLSKPFIPDKILVIAEKLIAEHRLKRESAAMQRCLSDAAIEAATKAADAAHGEHTDMHVERRVVTVIFTHIVGFTPMTESMEAEALVSLLNEYFDAITPVVKENGGIIDKFIGDCVMAVFHGEDDSSKGDSAFGAVKTGVEMQKRLKAFNEGRENPIDMRVGINSGSAIMGDIGASAVRRDHTVIGDNVNIAARLESSAAAGTVLISQSTYDLIPDRIVATELEPIMVKGKSEPVHVFRAEDVA